MILDMLIFQGLPGIGQVGPRGDPGLAATVNTQEIVDIILSQVHLDQGQKGERGERGEHGADGAAGNDGRDGIPGRDGLPGISGERVRYKRLYHDSHFYW